MKTIIVTGRSAGKTEVMTQSIAQALDDFPELEVIYDDSDEIVWVGNAIAEMISRPIVWSGPIRQAANLRIDKDVTYEAHHHHRGGATKRRRWKKQRASGKK